MGKVTNIAREHFRSRWVRAYFRANVAVAGFALAVVAGLSIGYAALSSTTGISGTAKILASSSKPASVHITDVSGTWGMNCATRPVAPSWTDTSFTISGQWVKTSLCSVMTTATIENDSAAPVTLKNLNKVVDNTSGMNMVSVSGLAVGGQVAAGATATISVLVYNISNFKGVWNYEYTLGFDVVTPPIIIVSDGITSYNIARGSTLDLDAKVKAIDYENNDVTASLVKSCTFGGAAAACPADNFASSAAGTWKVTWNVTADGLAAAPVTITVVVS